MRVTARHVLAAIAVALIVGPANAAEKVGALQGQVQATLNSVQEANSPYMRVFGVTPPPYGHVDFCMRDQ